MSCLYSFQFHKVRLKVPKMVGSAEGTKFQFHKVRLKGADKHVS